MSIALISDSHSNLTRVGRAVDLLRGRGVRTVIHCGDISSPAAVNAFSGLDVHWVLGNCDWDRDALQRAMYFLGHQCHGHTGRLVLEGRRIAFTHGHQGVILDCLIASAAHDVVVHGHTHERRNERVGRATVINPGALDHSRAGGFALLDLEHSKVEWVTFD
jgi:putative phosphoesterase